MSVLERFVFRGILCAAGIYTCRAEWTCLDKEVKELKGSMEKELISVILGLETLLDRQEHLEQWTATQFKKCVMIGGKR